LILSLMNANYATACMQTVNIFSDIFSVNNPNHEQA
jgi:hypothetical protein